MVDCMVWAKYAIWVRGVLMAKRGFCYGCPCIECIKILRIVCIVHHICLDNSRSGLRVFG